ncbi:hypothetical protein INN71_14065 [Nocardioides sp. ChNu-153]|uniref:hypothetical protein n=1 Tax=unclassified Nocardioides TaxID=2615069 RepID=UPI0024076E1C|nr:MULTISPECIES: hypothetical protein [unclassified Nocardioides]MDF9715276.1 hypothetical protein [Nocardioides sp. ChNu-99]MDN7122513.1 hypothetical protein [Nocardioides sp. ChNu-153]
MIAVPVSLTFAWWGTAWLRGRAAADDVLDALAEHGVRHVFAAPGEDPATAAEVLGGLRRAGAHEVGAAFPAPGDPVGLGGPRELNAAAIDAGEAVLAPAAGVGWVPVAVGAAVEWEQHPASRRPLPDVGAADRALRAALLEVAERLARLDVARWNPDLADDLLDLTAVPRIDAPDGVPARCVQLAARGLRLLRVAELGAGDDGAAVTLGETVARRAALDDLARAARHALTAAASPEAWPPD